LRRSGPRSQKPNRKLADQNFISKAAPDRRLQTIDRSLLHQTACAVRCAEGDFRVEAFFVASLKTSLVWDSSS